LHRGEHLYHEAAFQSHDASNFTIVARGLYARYTASSLARSQWLQQFHASIIALNQDPVNQMTSGQTMSYIDTVIKSLLTAS
jgi:hypothetical protein